MLSKAHISMSGSTWVTTPSWLSGSLRPFLYSFPVYSCYLFLISSASVRFLLFLSFTMPILAWNIPLISPVFLKRFIVFLTLLLSSISLIVHFRRLLYLSLLFSGTLHSVGYIFAFLLCLLLLFFPQLFVKSLRTITLPSCISFSLGWFWSLTPVQCYKHLSIVLQAPCLSDLIPWLNSLPLLYNNKGFKSYLNGLVVFSTFFNWSLNFAIRSWWSEPQSAPTLVFADCIELLHLWLQRIYQSYLVLTIWWCPCVKSSLVFLEECVCYDQLVLLTKLC